MEETVVLLGKTEKIGLTIMVIVLMLGMGSTLTWKDFRNALRKPLGFIIGIVSQFGFMPFLAYVLAKTFALPDGPALALVMVGCTPGGTTSNLFSYYSRGDVALSVSMTVASTFCAVLMMPLILSIYATGFTDTELVISYKDIIATLVVVLIPVALGMFIRSQNIKIATMLEKVASITGLLLIAFLFVEYLMKNLAIFLNTTLSFYSAGIILGVAGYIFGYLFSKACRIPEKYARSISLETGIQNTPLTIAIISLSFPEHLHNELLWIPMIYAVFVVFTSSLATLVFRRFPIDTSS